MTALPTIAASLAEHDWPADAQAAILADACEEAGAPWLLQVAQAVGLEWRSWSGSWSGPGSRPGSGSRSWSWSGSWSGPGSRPGSGSRSRSRSSGPEPEWEAGVQAEPGQTVVLETVVGRFMLGRFVRSDALYTVLTDVIRIHYAGEWTQFLQGTLGTVADDGSDMAVTGSPEPMGQDISVPTQLCWLRPWPGDLDAARARLMSKGGRAGEAA